jgi:hypothetical protein
MNENLKLNDSHEEGSLSTQEPHFTMSWNVREYPDKKRHPDWYWGVCLIAIGLAVLSVISGNLLFAIVIVLATMTLLLYAVRTPRAIMVDVGDDGIVVEGLWHPYKTLESFWIDTTDPYHAKLILEPKGTFSFHVVVPISGEIHENELREFLLKYLKEEEHEEPFAHKIMERLGF